MPGSSAELTKAIRAPFFKRHQVPANRREVDYAFDNDYAQIWRNAGGTADIEGLRVDENDKIRLGGEIFNPDYQVKTFHIEPNGSIADQVFWVSDGAYKVRAIYEIHKTKGSDSGAVTGTIKKAGDGVAIASGVALTSAINLKADNDTLQTATLSTVKSVYGVSVLEIAANDRIGIDYSGTLTALAGVCVIVVLEPGHQSDSVTFSVVANGSLADRAFYVAAQRRKITAIKYSHSAAGTDASAVNVQVTKDTSTDAPGAGTDLLTNNSNAGFNCKGTINTIQDGALSATAANLILAPGDRLSVDFAGTLTALAGVVVTVYFEPVMDRKEFTFFSPVDGTSLADQVFAIMDRNYEITAALAVWEVASSGATNVQLTLDSGTDAPGAGADLLSNDSSAGWQTDGTANTPEVATWIEARNNFPYAGERLAVDFNGTLTALAGFIATVVLKPV